MPVTRAVRPVRPPASTPAADSTKVVMVQLPVRPPAMVAMASEVRVSFMPGISPFSSSMPPRAAAPMTVPIVSNISMMQKVMTSVTQVSQPICIKPAKSILNRVVCAQSDTGGTKEAVASAAKGLVPMKANSQIQ